MGPKKERNRNFSLRQTEDYNTGTASQKFPRTVLPIEIKAQLCMSLINDVDCAIQLCKYKVVGHCDPLQNQERVSSFKELSWWCLENAVLCG